MAQKLTNGLTSQDKRDYTCDGTDFHEEAVAKVRGLMPPEDEFISLADLFKMFSDGTRVKILWALHQSELCVCDLASLLGATKSAVSHQLKLLRLSNLVKFRREGKSVFYSLADDHVESILETGFAHINE